VSGPLYFGMPAISVVIPCHNVTGTLERCSTALQDQTSYGFEIILVDNSSTDGAWEALQRWHVRHPDWIHVLRENKKGAAADRNAGIEVSRGTF